MVDKMSQPEDLLKLLEGILTDDCGSKGLRARIDYRRLSPANLSAQFDRASQQAEQAATRRPGRKNQGI
jgi:hypothetical protein